MQPSSSQQSDQTENIGDHEKDGNTSYDQEDTHNMDLQQKHGIMNTNYRNTQSSLTNTGISTGMTITWSETVERKLNSSRDACLNKGGNVTIYSLFSFILPNCDSGPVGLLISTSAWCSHVISSALCIWGVLVLMNDLYLDPHF